MTEPVNHVDPDKNAALSRLLMLASSNLPIGSYTYSQGVEPAIEAGLIVDEASMLDFMNDYLHLALYGYELPLLGLMIEALKVDDEALANALAADYHTSRESKEFVFESSQLALSLAAWLDEVIALAVPKDLLAHGFLPLFANISAHWGLTANQAMTTYAFGQIENMVLAAVKTVPLGQMAGQRIIWQLQQNLSRQLLQIAGHVNAVYEHYQQNRHTDLQESVSIDQHPSSRHCILAELYQQLDMSANLPHLAILSCQHEQQYSRLFRS